MNRIPIDIGSFWLPKQSSTLAADVDAAFTTVVYISAFFFLLVTGAVLYLAVRYRRRGPGQKTSRIDHSTALEITWTAIPAVMLVALFGIGLKGYINAAVAPAEAYEIKVTAEKWLWTFTYPTGLTTVNEMAVPKGRPVKLLMSSKDVIHSFSVPEFRIKQDVVPGAYTTMWFQATEVKEIGVFCAEYCGTGHSDMSAKIMVMDEVKFKEWLDQGAGGGDVPPAELGKKLFVSRSCATCHSLDGSRLVGPTFKGLLGRTEQLEGGGSVVVDETYVRESIYDPMVKIVRGYPPSMPTFKGVVKDQEVDAIIAFLKTVN